MELVQQREKGKQKGRKWANSEHEEKRKEVGRSAENGSEVHLTEKKEGNKKRKEANGRHEERRGKEVKEKR